MSSAVRSPRPPSGPLDAWLQTRMSMWPSAPAAAVIRASGAPGAARSQPRCGGGPGAARAPGGTAAPPARPRGRGGGGSRSAAGPWVSRRAPHGRWGSGGTGWWANTAMPAARSRRAVANPMPARRLTPVMSACTVVTMAGLTDSLFPRPPAEIAPGAVHVPGFLGLERQRELVHACRGGATRMRHTKLPGGGVMAVQRLCLGWYWLPSRYSRTADEVDGAPVAPFPDWLAELGREALSAAYGDPAPAYTPDAALINFYDAH